VDVKAQHSSSSSSSSWGWQDAATHHCRPLLVMLLVMLNADYRLITASAHCAALDKPSRSLG